MLLTFGVVRRQIGPHSGPYWRMPEIILYTRRNCCLCDQAAEILDRYALDYRAVDLDSEGTPQQRQEFDDCVPVVAFDGVVRFRGQINEVLLRRLISGGRR